MNFWYRFSIISILLLPLSFVFQLIISLRYFFYRIGLKKTTTFKVPIIVVGNISVGGTGKTPLVIWLVHFLQKKGFNPGVVSRGVGGKKHIQPLWITEFDDPLKVGDEAVLIAKKTHCPVVIAADRVAAVHELLNKTQCNIVISDDGLQHYRLGRHIEIAVVDGKRYFGNGRLLPAGPLRELKSRLRRVDFICINSKKRNSSKLTPKEIQDKNVMDANLNHLEYKQSHLTNKKLKMLCHFKNVYFMEFKGDYAINVLNNSRKLLKDFKANTLHAVAGIGNPDRFFTQLKENNLNIIEHPFPDHHNYLLHDFNFKNNDPILMTEKDAVKCTKWKDKRFWSVPIDVYLDEAFSIDLLKKINELPLLNSH